MFNSRRIKQLENRITMLEKLVNNLMSEMKDKEEPKTFTRR